MAETTQNSVENPRVDSPTEQAVTSEPKITEGVKPSVTDADYKNLQSFATKTSQELKALREEQATKDQDYATTSAKAKELDEKFNRLQQAFSGAAPTEPQLSPEQVAELDRLLQQTPTYRTLAEQTRAQQIAGQWATARQHDMAVNEAAIELTNQFKMTDEQGANLKKFIMEDPAIVGGIQNAATKEQALRTFRNAYMAWDYNNLKNNAVALGTKQVEQKLKAMEAGASVESATQTAAVAGGAELKYVPGRGLDGVWDQISAQAKQQHGVT